MSKALAPSFHVLSVDQRNHGRSPHSDVFTYKAMAADLLELLDERSISSANVLGHSMGGKTAMEFALTHPERVDSLIVVDIAPRAYPRLHDELLDALLSVDLATTVSRQQVDEQLSHPIPDFAVRQFLMKNLSRNEQGSFRWKANLGIIHTQYAEIARAISSNRPFSKPTLFIRSTRSGYVTDADIPGIRSRLPAARIADVDTGHWIHAEAPTRFSEIVLGFLSQNTHS